jgi:hemolysin III
LIKIKDKVSALTHFLGVLIFVPISIFLIRTAIIEKTPLSAISLAIFGLALFLLYSASTIYHTFDLSENKNKILKKLDHMMIFVLIAGTYTPISLVVLGGKVGYTMFLIIWIIAIAGMFLKAFWIDAPRHLSTAIYIFMGWLVILVMQPLSLVVSAFGLALLIIGGILYTLGGVIYALKWPKPKAKIFGFHEIFHILVLGGSFFHLMFMFMYV